MLFFFSRASRIYKINLYPSWEREKEKIRAAYFCFKFPACPKLVLARAYLKGELLRGQFFPILMIFPAITELVNCILKILLYHDCLPFGKLLHMGGNVTEK